jgi:hypothetical protein
VARLNNIKPPYSLHDVEVLYIPDASSTTTHNVPMAGFGAFMMKPFAKLFGRTKRTKSATPITQPEEYTIIVDKGDTKKDIENHTGVKWDAIAKHNKLKKTFKLKANVELLIPGKKPKQ